MLVLGCPEGLSLRIHDAAVSVGAYARLCGVITLRRAAERFRPFVIAMTEDLYAFDPERFVEVANEIGAELCTLSEDIDDDELAGLLAERLAALRASRFPSESGSAGELG